MITHSLKKLPKNTVELKVTIPWNEIEKEYDKSFVALQNELTVEGFRKGKAPKAIAEKHIDKEDVYQHLIRTMLPTIYDDIVKKENLKPVVSPRVDLTKAKENEDWEITITVAEKPIINLGNYKEAVKKAKAGMKKADIWVPGKDQKPAEQKPEDNRQQLMNEALTAVLKEAKVEIADMVLQAELESRLSRLVDDIQKIGLTTDSYLKSKNTTMDELKAQYTKEIEDTYRLEFILAEIAEKEGITVEEKDLQQLFGTITDEKEKAMAQQNAYFYASILRKQKTLDYLISL